MTELEKQLIRLEVKRDQAKEELDDLHRQLKALDEKPLPVQAPQTEKEFIAQVNSMPLKQWEVYRKNFNMDRIDNGIFLGR